MTDTAMDADAGKPSHTDALAAMRARQNFALAVPAGLAAAVVGAIGWAAFGYFTESEFGLIAIAIGAIVGLAIRRVGNGVDPRFGVLGAACAALGWALGTVLCDLAFLAREVHRPIIDTFAAIGLGQTAQLAAGTLGGMDLLFLGIAVWEGWKLSRHRI